MSETLPHGADAHSMAGLTKYKLLINNILKSYKKDWDKLDGKNYFRYILSLHFVVHTEEDNCKKEGTKIETAHTCVKVVP